MKNKDIQSREDIVTRDITKGEVVEQTFNIPSLGVSVVARSMDEALIKAKALIKSNK